MTIIIIITSMCTYTKRTFLTAQSGVDGVPPIFIAEL